MPSDEETKKLAEALDPIQIPPNEKINKVVEAPVSIGTYEEEKTIEEKEEIDDEIQVASVDQAANYRELGIELYRRSSTWTL